MARVQVERLIVLTPTSAVVEMSAVLKSMVVVDLRYYYCYCYSAASFRRDETILIFPL